MNVVRRCRYGMMTYNISDIWVGRALEKYGESMESEIGVIRSILKTGDYAIDAGAGIGTHTLPMSKFVGPDGVITAFEPERNSFYNLCSTVSTNSLRNVYCFHQALGNSDGLVDLPELLEEGTIHYGGLSLLNDFPESRKYKVQLRTIDDLDLPRCDFIKIDVEGMEKHVLEGAVNTINKFRPVIYVENDAHCNEAVKTIMTTLDYEIHIHTAPLFNPQNFYHETENVFITESGSIYVTSMFLCLPRDRPAPLDTKIWNMENIRFANSKCALTHGGQGTTTLSTPTRVRNNDYKKYFQGTGIDIGGGYDTLQTAYGTVHPWDIRDGDATLMEGVPDESYDFVYSSHCLEHIADVPTALKNWVRILKPGGKLFVVVPDWELYEQQQWPSRYNADHKATFSTRVSRSDLGRTDHFNVEGDIKPLLSSLGVDLLESRIEDDRYNYTIKDVDQTGPAFNAIAQVCFIGQKRV